MVPEEPPQPVLVLRRLAEQIRRYRRTVSWLLRDLVVSCPGSLAGVALTGVVAVFLQLGAIVLLLAYVNALIDQRPIELGALSLPVSAELPTLIAWSATGFVLAAAGAGAAYGNAALSFHLADRYTRLLLGRVMERLGQFPWESMTSSADEAIRFSRNLLVGDAVSLLRVTRVVAQAILPLFTWVVVAAAVVYLDPFLASILLVVGVASVVPLYQLNKRIVAASRFRDIQRSGVRDRGRRAVELLLLPHTSREDRRRVADDFLDSKELRASLASLRDLMITSDKVRALQGFVTWIVLAAVLVTFGAFLARGPGSWVQLLTFLVALRYLGASWSRLAVSWTAFNRFLPQFSRVVDFLRGADRREEGPSPSSPPGTGDPWTAEIEVEGDIMLPGSRERLTLTPGMVVLCSCPSRAFGGNIHRIREALGGGVEVFLCPDPAQLPNLPALELAVWGKGADRSERLMPRELDLLAPLGLETDFLTTDDGERTIDTAFALAIAPGILLGAPVLILPRHCLGRLERSERQRVLDLLAEHAVLVTDRGVGWGLGTKADAVLVLDEDWRPVGIGDEEWFRELGDSTPVDVADDQDDDDDL